MSRTKKILLVLLPIFIGIQFIQPARNAAGQASPADIAKTFSLPPYMQSLLQNACYDCHSNNTRYPWYSFIQPASWWMASHIKKGKQELNFNEFGSYSVRRQKSKLQAIANSLNDGTMPLSSYAFLHSNARLSADQKETINHWIKTALDTLSTK